MSDIRANRGSNYRWPDRNADLQKIGLQSVTFQPQRGARDRVGVQLCGKMVG